MRTIDDNVCGGCDGIQEYPNSANDGDDVETKEPTYLMIRATIDDRDDVFVWHRLDETSDEKHGAKEYVDEASSRHDGNSRNLALSYRCGSSGPLGLVKFRS